MRIALYCPNKPLSHPDPSGDLVIARGLVAALTRMGHECCEASDFRSRWFWKTWRGRAMAAAGVLQGMRRSLAFRPRLWLTYHTYYKSPDVVGPWIARMLRIPYVLFQPMYATRRRKDPSTRPGFLWNRSALRSARHCFTNNLDDLEALSRAVSRHRITYVPPGIYPEEFRRDRGAGRAVRERFRMRSREPLLLAAARFRADVKFRSLSYLLEALGPLASRRGDFKLALVGSGPMERELKRLAGEKLPGRAIFAGGVARERMFEYYSAADLFVFPGIGESLGMVFLEAQACGLPVVALKTAGVPQVVRHGETGILVPDDGGAALAGAVEELLLDPDKRRRLGGNGPVFIRRERNLHVNYGLLSEKLAALAAGNEGSRKTES